MINNKKYLYFGTEDGDWDLVLVIPAIAELVFYDFFGSGYFRFDAQTNTIFPYFEVLMRPNHDTLSVSSMTLDIAITFLSHFVLLPVLKNNN